MDLFAGIDGAVASAHTPHTHTPQGVEPIDLVTYMTIVPTQDTFQTLEQDAFRAVASVPTPVTC